MVLSQVSLPHPGLRQSAALCHAAEVQMTVARVWRQTAVKSMAECEKCFGKEEKAEACRCDNYAGLLRTGRWVLLAPICVPSAPDPSPSTKQNYSLFAFYLIYTSSGLERRWCLWHGRVQNALCSSPPNHTWDVLFSKGLTSLQLWDLPHIFWWTNHRLPLICMH